MNEHTPGPWAVNASSQTAITTVDIVPLVIGTVWQKGRVKRNVPDRETAFANARLIAAAPDLLSALQDTLSCLENWVEVASEEDMRDYDIAAIEKARTAIKKATEGE